MIQHQRGVYFPNLNGLRFIAASLVIIHHIEQFKSLAGIDSNWGAPAVLIIGKLGVVLFFVLSGFLITYLLLSEEQKLGTISIQKFYIRRILRIWPLYFLIAILALLVLPNIELFTNLLHGDEPVGANFGWKVVLYTFFLPNLALAIYGLIPYVGHAWSIGTEEQFYLIWPVVLKYFRKYRIILMFMVIITYLAIKAFLAIDLANMLPYRNVIREFWSMFNIDCMAVGGIFAIILFQKHFLLRWLLNNTVFYSITALTVLLMIKGVYIPIIQFEFYSILFGIIILNFAANIALKSFFENRMLIYLGNISYGLYMYHPVAIVIAMMVALNLKVTTNWLIYPLAFMLTALLAALSYKYFESRFLKFKNKFSNITSGRDAITQ